MTDLSLKSFSESEKEEFINHCISEWEKFNGSKPHVPSLIGETSTVCFFVA